MTNIYKKIVGYSNVMSLRPLEKISFMVSCDKKIKLINSRFVKLIQGDCNPEGPGFKEEEVLSYKIKKHKASNQKIYSGSYIFIPLKNTILIKKEITFIAFIKPTLNEKLEWIMLHYTVIDKNNPK